MRLVWVRAGGQSPGPFPWLHQR